jgi:hypothetical protein
VLHAKELVRCVGGPSATVSGHDAGASGRGKPEAGCKPELAALETATTGFRAHYEANREQAEAVFWMSAFEAEVGEFLGQAEAVVGKPGKGGPTPEQITKLVDEHDDLVSDANNLRFDR